MTLLRAVPKPEPRQPKGKRAVPRVNPVRKVKRFEAAYGAKGEWIRSLPCCCTGRRTGEWFHEQVYGFGWVQVGVIAAHFPSRGAGGSAKHLVPLADHLHRWAHERGEKALERRFGVDFRALAKDYEARWQTKLRSEAARLRPRGRENRTLDG